MNCLSKKKVKLKGKKVDCTTVISGMVYSEETRGKQALSRISEEPKISLSKFMLWRIWCLM